MRKPLFAPVLWAAVLELNCLVFGGLPLVGLVSVPAGNDDLGGLDWVILNHDDGSTDVEFFHHLDDLQPCGVRDLNDLSVGLESKSRHCLLLSC